MADKDRRCTPLCFLLHTPHLCFQFPEDGGSGEGLLLGEGERGREGKEEGSRKTGATRAGELWQSGEEQTGFISNVQARGCWRGVGWVRHWDNQ